MERIYSTADVAEQLGVERWQVVRLFEDRTLPEPPRHVGRRIINAALLKKIVVALERRGWLPVEEEEAVANN